MTKGSTYFKVHFRCAYFPLGDLSPCIYGNMRARNSQTGKIRPKSHYYSKIPHQGPHTHKAQKQQDLTTSHQLLLSMVDIFNLIIFDFITKN